MSIRKMIAMTALSTVMGAGAAIAGDMKNPVESSFVDSDIKNENTAANFEYDPSNPEGIERTGDFLVVEDESMGGGEKLGEIEPYRPQTAAKGDEILDAENNPVADAD